MSLFSKDPDYSHPREDHGGDGPCLACDPPSRKVAASSLAGVRVKVHLQHSFGTFAMLDRELPRLARFLEYQASRFFIREKLKGDWSLLVYVSREEVK